MKHVVITGIGSITPAGNSMDETWQQLLTGESFTQTIDRFDASRYQTQVAGQANGFKADAVLSPRFVKRTDRFTHLAMATVQQAIADAHLTIDADNGVDPTRVGV